MAYKDRAMPQTSNMLKMEIFIDNANEVRANDKGTSPDPTVEVIPDTLPILSGSVFSCIRDLIGKSPAEIKKPINPATAIHCHNADTWENKIKTIPSTNSRASEMIPRFFVGFHTATTKPPTTIPTAMALSTKLNCRAFPSSNSFTMIGPASVPGPVRQRLIMIPINIDASNRGEFFT